jgi:hypothetical protein
MIAAIMYDEIAFEDILDQFQNSGGQISLNDNDFAKSFGRFLIQASAGLKPLDEVSIGIAQMQLRRFKDLVNQGYINPPPKWDKDPTEATIKFLLNPQKVPYAVAAELQRIVDFWRKGGVDISKNILSSCISTQLEQLLPRESTQIRSPIPKVRGKGRLVICQG